MFNVQTVLVLAPHTDDGEFGCGGTIARLTEEGKTILYVTFSICETSVPKDFPPDILATEARRATRILNIPLKHLTIHKYPVRHFPQYRQELLEELIILRNRLKPDLVLLPLTDDIHQDHQVISQEGVRAFKHTTILGYELPWNNLQSNVSTFISLEDRHIEKKIQAIQQYESQMHRVYADEGFIKSLARVRGKQVDSDYAEAFQVIRWIIR